MGAVCVLLSIMLGVACELRTSDGHEAGAPAGLRTGKGVRVPAGRYQVTAPGHCLSTNGHAGCWHVQATADSTPVHGCMAGRPTPWDAAPVKVKVPGMQPQPKSVTGCQLATTPSATPVPDALPAQHTHHSGRHLACGPHAHWRGWREPSKQVHTRQPALLTVAHAPPIHPLLGRWRAGLAATGVGKPPPHTMQNKPCTPTPPTHPPTPLLSHALTHAHARSGTLKARL
jgi:hypothetical protein